MKFVFDKDDIEQLIDDEYDDEIITKEEKEKCMNDLKLNDYSVYTRVEGEFLVVEVEFDFAKQSLSEYVKIIYG
jgi:hypothetical protein